MSDVQERRIGALVVKIDRNLCVGFGDCVDEAPDTFVLDDDGIAVVRDGAGADDTARLIEACRACPVDALSLFDQDGDQLAP